MTTVWNVLESALGTVLGVVFVGAVLVIHDRRQRRRCPWHTSIECGPACRARRKAQRRKTP